VPARKGEYPVRSGPLAGRVFGSYYQYQNAKARREGFGNYYQLRKAKASGSYKPPEPTPSAYDLQVRRNLVQQMGERLRGNELAGISSRHTFQYKGVNHETPDWVNMNDTRPGGSFAHYLEEDLGIREKNAPYNVGETPTFMSSQAA
jgi:hypothetical protein